jgi:hypothetical protein
VKLIFGSALQTPGNYRKLSSVMVTFLVCECGCTYTIPEILYTDKTSVNGHTRKNNYIFPVGEEKNFDLYNVGRVPYLRADPTQKTYTLGISKTKVPVTASIAFDLPPFLCAQLTKS